MNRRNALAAGVSLALSATLARGANRWPQVEVFKSPSCGCCAAWAEHLQSDGFPVKVTVVNDTTAVRKRYRLPDRFGSCHTAVVDGYVVEGHVPAEQVKRLLKLRPAAVGLAVPGMPPGSPGMDVPGRSDPYTVFLIDKQGRESAFANYPKS